MKTKFLLFLVAHFLPASVLADVWQDPVLKVNYEYTVGESEASVTQSQDVTGAVSILSQFSVNGQQYKVTSIGRQAFYNCRNFTSVIIPEGVTTIGNSAFSGCHELIDVTIPSTMKSFGNCAFSNCSFLTNVHITDLAAWCQISCNAGKGSNPLTTATHLFLNGSEVTNLVVPSGVTSIGQCAFEGWNGLKKLTIPATVTEVGEGAFGACTALTELTCGANIEQAAFSGCTSLTKVTLLEGVAEISEFAFWECENLTDIAVPASLTKVGIGNGTAFGNCKSITNIYVTDLAAWCLRTYQLKGLWSSDGPFHLFMNGQEVKDLVVPNGMTTLSSSAFSSFASLTSVKIPATITSIGAGAFSGCTGLEEVHSEISEPFSIGSNVFSSETYAKTLYVPYGTKALYEDTNGWKDFKNIIEEGDASDNVTLTAKSYSRVYGDANPTFEYTVTNGTITSGTPTITCSATTTSPVGTYDIVIAKGTVSNSNVELVKGTLTITKAPLTISAGNYTKVEGEENPAFKATYSGFKNNETETVLTEMPTITTTATKTSLAGSYTITVSGADAQNYAITYQNGTLTITDPVEVELTDVSNIDNVIYIEPIEETKGSEVVVPILMKNTADIRGFQFDLYLPNGVTVAKTSKGKFVCSLSSGRLPEDDEHTLTVSEQGDGALRFLCGSQYNETFTGTEGEIATMKLLIAEDMAEGEHPIVLKKVKLSETDISNYYYTETVQTSLTVVSYVSGDISGDGEIDVSDYIGVANFIMGDKPEGFIEAAADVNKDKVVDVSDYIGVANIILYDNIYGPVANASRSIDKMENTSSVNDNLIYIEPFKADANSQATVSLKMKNTADIRGFQFDLYLPEGIIMVKNGKNLLSDSRKPAGDQHTLTLSEQQDGAIRFLCSSMDDETFTGNDGEIATLTVSIAGDMAQGDYPILLKKMKLSETNISNCYETESRMATITINNNSATGIEQLTTGSGNETYYNLQGQRVNTPAKGVFVKNGKKVMMK